MGQKRSRGNDSGFGVREPIEEGSAPPPPAAPLPRWVRDFWRHHIYAGAMIAPPGKARAQTDDNHGGSVTWDWSQAVSAGFGGLSPGGLIAIHLGRHGRALGCRRCGNVARIHDMLRCGRCGATLCGGTCAVPCKRTGSRFVSGCTAKFCYECEPVHKCVRGASCGVSCRNPQVGMGKRSELQPGRLVQVGMRVLRSNSSPPGGAGAPPPRPVDYEAEDWAPVCM